MSGETKGGAREERERELWIQEEKTKTGGTSLVVQWLRLHAPNAGGLGSIPDQGTRSLRPQLKIFAPAKMEDSMFPMQGAWVQSPVRELDLTCRH